MGILRGCHVLRNMELWKIIENTMSVSYALGSRKYNNKQKEDKEIGVA